MTAFQLIRQQLRDLLRTARLAVTRPYLFPLEAA